MTWLTRGWDWTIQNTHSKLNHFEGSVFFAKKVKPRFVDSQPKPPIFTTNFLMNNLSEAFPFHQKQRLRWDGGQRPWKPWERCGACSRGGRIDSE